MSSFVGAARGLTGPRRDQLTAALAFVVAATVGLTVAIGVHTIPGPLAFVGLFLGAVVVWMFFTERVLLSLAILVVFLGTLDGFLKLKTGSGAVTLVRDVLIFAIASSLLVRRLVRHQHLDPPPLTGWIAAFVALVVAETANPSNGTLVHSVAAWRQHLEFVPLFFIGFIAMRSKRSLQLFFLILLAVTAVNAVVAYIQFRLSPDQLASWGPGYERLITGGGLLGARIFKDSNGLEHVRPPALGSDMGFGGLLGMLAAPAALALLGAARFGRLRTFAIAPLALGVVAAVATSQARVAVLGAVLSVGVFVALGSTSRRALEALFTLAIGAMIAVVLILALGSQSGVFYRYSSIAPDQLGSTLYSSRIDTISLIPSYALRYPLGAGLGSVGPVSGAVGGAPEASNLNLNVESEPTFMLVELGIPGLLLLLGFSVHVLIMVVTRIRAIEDQELRILLAALAAPLFALLGTWLVGATSALSPGSPYLWFASGVLVYWLHPRSRRRRQDA
jgi:hypothetical protein